MLAFIKYSFICNCTVCVIRILYFIQSGYLKCKINKNKQKTWFKFYKVYKLTRLDFISESITSELGNLLTY